MLLNFSHGPHLLRSPTSERHKVMHKITDYALLFIVPPSCQLQTYPIDANFLNRLLRGTGGFVNPDEKPSQYSALTFSLIS